MAYNTTLLPNQAPGESAQFAGRHPSQQALTQGWEEGHTCEETQGGSLPLGKRLHNGIFSRNDDEEDDDDKEKDDDEDDDDKSLGKTTRALENGTNLITHVLDLGPNKRGLHRPGEA